MTILTNDVVDDALTIATGARDAAIANGLGNMIAAVVEGALAVYAARHIEQGLLAVAKTIESAGVDQSIQIGRLSDAILHASGYVKEPK